VDNAIWQPGENIEDGELMCREDIGEVGAVKDIFEGRKNLNPNVRPNICRNESVTPSAFAHTRLIHNR
jgi:hypothetical protein